MLRRMKKDIGLPEKIGCMVETDALSGADICYVAGRF
jgi:hypothetical protein